MQLIAHCTLGHGVSGLSSIKDACHCGLVRANHISIAQHVYVLFFVVV